MVIPCTTQDASWPPMHRPSWSVCSVGDMKAVFASLSVLPVYSWCSSMLCHCTCGALYLCCKLEAKVGVTCFREGVQMSTTQAVAGHGQVGQQVMGHAGC